MWLYGLDIFTCVVHSSSIVICRVIYNALLSKGMEGKIGDLGTARLVDPRRQSRMTQAPGTAHFMPPEALADVTNIRYGKELDVFSFGCVMLHTLSHLWPTPSYLNNYLLQYIDMLWSTFFVPHPIETLYY